MQIKQKLNRLMAEAAKSAGIPLEDPRVVEAGKPEFGDYQFNGAMPLAKALRQNPRQIAQSLVDHLPENPIIAGAEIAGPGFINLTLESEWLAGELEKSFGDERRSEIIKSDTEITMEDLIANEVRKLIQVLKKNILNKF